MTFTSSPLRRVPASPEFEDGSRREQRMSQLVLCMTESHSDEFSCEIVTSTAAVLSYCIAESLALGNIKQVPERSV